ncbi:Hypothetical protein NTJ_00943 [Nesidiocoris tenuis]|uniref:Uncharacterized protein n=1 Tax=Nesidiocoris tenuis TaxID=355587 RepID=A0ABN7A7B7_9HEMI|nr:Hypothetical protein NTJ_00943 [Nesidiocoris tenuis]
MGNCRIETPPSHRHDKEGLQEETYGEGERPGAPRACHVTSTLGPSCCPSADRTSQVFSTLGPELRPLSTTADETRSSFLEQPVTATPASVS